MKKYARDNRPHLKPVTRIELPEKNTKLRVILIVILLSIGAVALTSGLLQLLNVEPGWQSVEVSSRKPNCGGDFVLMYDFSDYGGSATAANRELTALYSEAAEKAYVIFSADVEDAAVQNLRQVNRHVNQPVTVDAALYDAFSLISQTGNRSIYLAPAYEEYKRIFLCENEEEAVRYDPAFQEELRPYLREIAAFAADPQAVDVVLLGNNQVQLNVSEEYLAFAQEYEIDSFVDFSWLKNAFVADYLARVLMEQGFTRGYLASFDGFTRNLDTREHPYSINLFDRQGSQINLPVRMNYSGPQSIVFLRDYPMGDQDRWHYYTYASGHITGIHLDPADGENKTSVDSLAGFSQNKGCSEILLELIPVFVAEELDTEMLKQMASDGVYAVWYDDYGICTTGEKASLELLDGAYFLK